MTFLVDLLIWDVRGGWTHKNARVLLLRGWFLFGFQNLLGASYVNLRMYRSMRQIHAQVCVAGAQKILKTKQEPTAKRTRAFLCVHPPLTPHMRRSTRKVIES